MHSILSFHGAQPLHSLQDSGELIKTQKQKPENAPTDKNEKIDLLIRALWLLIVISSIGVVLAMVPCVSVCALKGRILPAQICLFIAGGALALFAVALPCGAALDEHS